MMCQRNISAITTFYLQENVLLTSVACKNCSVSSRDPPDLPKNKRRTAANKPRLRAHRGRGRALM